MLEANAQNTVKCKLSLFMALKWVNANFDVLYALIFDNLKAKIGFNSSSLKLVLTYFSIENKLCHKFVWVATTHEFCNGHVAAGFFFTKSAICASGNISCKVDPKQMVAAHQLLLLWLAVMDVAFQISKQISLFGTLSSTFRIEFHSLENDKTTFLAILYTVH